MALRDVLLDELRDMYSVENQLVKALPKLAKGANNPKLKTLFSAHLAETKGQVERLKQVFEHLEEKPTGEHCNGMEGIIEEGKDALEKDEKGASFDSGLIGAALRTEHYEVAGYETCISMATTLGMPKVVTLLKANLKEEMAAAKKVTAAGVPIMKQSAREPEAPKKPKTGKEKYSAMKSKEDEAKASQTSTNPVKSNSTKPHHDNSENDSAEFLTSNEKNVLTNGGEAAINTTRTTNDRFGRFAASASSWLGSKWAFAGAGLVIVIWAFTGPIFHYSDTWQLVINTGTTIVTFLMVFLIQNTQNRDARAINLKLNELIRALGGRHEIK